MKVTLAKSAGFCFGVKRAVDMVYEQIEDAKERPIYTYGPIIHNEEVVKELAEKGVRVIAEDEDLHGWNRGQSSSGLTAWDARSRKTWKMQALPL